MADVIVANEIKYAVTILSGIVHSVLKVQVRIANDQFLPISARICTLKSLPIMANRYFQFRFNQRRKKKRKKKRLSQIVFSEYCFWPLVFLIWRLFATVSRRAIYSSAFRYCSNIACFNRFRSCGPTPHRYRFEEIELPILGRARPKEKEKKMEYEIMTGIRALMNAELERFLILRHLDQQLCMGSKKRNKVYRDQKSVLRAPITGSRQRNFEMEGKCPGILKYFSQNFTPSLTCT